MASQFVSDHRSTTSDKMKLSIIASLVASAAAFTAPQKSGVSSTALNAKFKPKLQYVPCIDIEDLPDPGSATSGVAGGLAICIAVDPSGSVYALGDKCPPVNQPLSFGKVNADGTIQDPVLGTKFSLKTGDVVGAWCPSGIGKLIGGAFSPVGVPTYPVRKSKNSIEVQVDVNAKFNFEANYWSGILDAQGKADGKYY
mmetsp:Transcript_73259/g.212178  ORF Transcript_73259/g.212178 Transcript_73259/m.212178 type:complete len:198 (-) Transcript_73259:235-828(-)